MININDKISKDFAAYWQDLITAGVVETKPGFNNEWYTGLDSGRYATWLTAGWGPVFLTSFAKTSAGKWRAADLPQWDASKFATGNWGGSTLAVMKATQHLPEAAEVAIWLATNPEATKLYTTKQFFFPCTNALLSSAGMGGQQDGLLRRPGGEQSVRQIGECRERRLSGARSRASSTSRWPMNSAPRSAARARCRMRSTASRTAVVTYAKEQGFTVD